MPQTNKKIYRINYDFNLLENIREITNILNNKIYFIVNDISKDIKGLNDIIKSIQERIEK